jgi:hypothetical protein
MVSLSRRNSALISMMLMVQQQESFAFHAALPNRARMITNRISNGSPPYDIIIALNAISSEEAVERMREQQRDKEVMEAEQPPMLFDEDMIAEMNAVYMTLEKRIQNGPGGLSGLEIDQLEARMKNIIVEMKQNELQRPTKPTPGSEPKSVGAEENENPETLQPIAISQLSTSTITPVVMDTSQDEGPQYDGSGGLGQPRGTVNTYTIEGMEDMTSEEYITALENRIKSTQYQRRMTGQAGNRSAWNYLSSLTGQTEGVLKRKNGILNDDGDEN